MNKVEKLFDSYKGLILFYIIVAILAFMFSNKIKKENIQSRSEKIVETRSYYA